MKKQIDILFITNLPSFYKINLFNSIAKQKNIFVIFTHDQNSQRNEDFYNGLREFSYVSLAKKMFLGKIFYLIYLLFTSNCKSLIVGGWDQLLFWFAIAISPKEKNGVLVESSILESKVTGFMSRFKTIFLSRIYKAYVSGKSQADLCIKLGFKGQLIKTNGVGIFNVMPQPEYSSISIVKNFIYVGRLSPEKNIKLLIEIFNMLPELTLNIVGFGPQDIFLKSIAKKNIVFHGAIPNSELYKIYLQNDVFILPSISEPWGMVIEEAFNSGLPVIVSDRVGCAEEIVNSSNGIIESHRQEVVP